MGYAIDLEKNKRSMRQGLLSEEGVVVRFRVRGFEGDDVECDELRMNSIKSSRRCVLYKQMQTDILGQSYISSASLSMLVNFRTHPCARILTHTFMQTISDPTEPALTCIISGLMISLYLHTTAISVDYYIAIVLITYKILID